MVTAEVFFEYTSTRKLNLKIKLSPKKQLPRHIYLRFLAQNYPTVQPHFFSQWVENDVNLFHFSKIENQFYC